MGVCIYVPEYTQLYVQLCIQPHFLDETCTISTTPPPPFWPSRSMALPEPFNRTFNACAVRRITRAHGRAAPAAPLPCRLTGTMPPQTP